MRPMRIDVLNDNGMIPSFYKKNNGLKRTWNLGKDSSTQKRRAIQNDCATIIATPWLGHESYEEIAG